ncbi:type II toxin-antitoxin system HicB family antitoxin [Serratia marcescens]|uniref:type II toxin-antitoxin system HicB family antitoxin n=1 Tax=Serratia marcescens TaxID=615 RepID=UPI00301C23F0
MMNNTLKIDGHTAVINFDPEIEMFRGEFVGLNGGADFYAYSVDELKKEGAISLVVFLDECQKDGIEPYKSYSGKVTTRLSPERHQALAIAAQATGQSINELLNEGVDLVIEKHS